jgi:hypothetical protein
MHSVRKTQCVYVTKLPSSWLKQQHMGLVLLECSIRTMARITTSIAEVLLWFLLAPSVKSRESPLNYNLNSMHPVVCHKEGTYNVYKSMQSTQQYSVIQQLNLVSLYAWWWTSIRVETCSVNKSKCWYDSVDFLFNTEYCCVDFLHILCTLNYATIGPLYVISDSSFTVSHTFVCIRSQRKATRKDMSHNIATSWPYKLFHFYQSGSCLRNHWS